MKKAPSEDRAFNIKKQLSQAASGRVSRRSSFVSRIKEKSPAAAFGRKFEILNPKSP